MFSRFFTLEKVEIHEISMRYPTLPQEGAFMEALAIYDYEYLA